MVRAAIYGSSFEFQHSSDAFPNLFGDGGIVASRAAFEAMQFDGSDAVNIRHAII